MRISKVFMLNVVVLFVASTFFLGKTNASTHELETLDIHVFIEEDGSATIKENRLVTLSEGTENYIVIDNLGKSEIIDFEVYEDGEMYEYIEDWDLDWTREAKTFKSSVIKKEGHDELVWGIGEYGQHEYELIYTITDFIKQLEDTQMMFWQFVNSDTNIPPKNVTITIETNHPITDEHESIWAFGFEGDIHFEDGKIVAQSHSPLDRSDYVTILTEFPNSDFGTNDVLGQTFAEVKEQAFEGSDYKEEYSFPQFLIRFFVIVLLIIGVFVLVSYFIVRMEDKKKSKPYEGKYYREIPYDGEPYMVYGLLIGHNLANLDHLLTVFILKWIHEDRLRITHDMKKGIFRVKEVSALHIAENGAEGLTGHEATLFSIFVSASDDGVIRQNEFRKWSRKHYKRMTKWEQEVLKASYLELDEQGFVNRKEVEIYGKPSIITPFTTKGNEFIDRVYMFKNYLRDYSLLYEHEPVNVKLWDELMIWAAMLGITEAVYEQFKALYPEYEQESIYSDTAIRTATVFSAKVSGAVTSARSGGFGGASSSGGGGGSFGGGSGGGTR